MIYCNSLYDVARSIQLLKNVKDLPHVLNDLTNARSTAENIGIEKRDTYEFVNCSKVYLEK